MRGSGESSSGHRDFRDWGARLKRYNPEGCVIMPQDELVRRMDETGRGFSTEEVENAVYRGQKHFIRPNKYRGEFGNCRVIVIIRRCHLEVYTVFQ